MAIVLFTDFGADLYVGQVKAVLLEGAPDVPVIDLLHDAPAFDVRAGAHLLAACLEGFPRGSVFLAVVDPGVGTDRPAIVAECAGRYLVGPDNGLISVCSARAAATRIWSIAWRPQHLSRSFHGRDLFAPVAAAIAAGPWPDPMLVPARSLKVSFDAGDLPAVIYIDRYGNACTGLRASSVAPEAILVAGGAPIAYAAVFEAAADARPFWYENSLGLVEIAVRRGDARAMLGLRVGDRLDLE